ncbi:hypothetical protein BKI52_23745 [marine bacterium AO1-C]|nr:hypothetical protein BKI52_23745 [marine bacterium AO1-C]
MKPASIKELKYELGNRSEKELVELCLKIAKFKKDNKELLTYLLFEASDEEGYVANIKTEMEEEFALLNTKSFHIAKKGVWRIQRTVKKYIRYSKNKETEVELMLYFCNKLHELHQNVGGGISYVLQNLLDRQIASVRKAIAKLHEDLQYDYNLEVESLVDDIRSS